MRSCLDLLLELNEERGFKKGEKSGQKRGELLALRTILQGLLHTRFGAVPARVRDRVSTGTAGSLQRWSLRVVTAQRIDDVFAGD